MKSAGGPRIKSCLDAVTSSGGILRGLKYERYFRVSFCPAKWQIFQLDDWSTFSEVGGESLTRSLAEKEARFYSAE